MQLYGSVIDYSYGCNHWGYYTTARLQSPSGRLGVETTYGMGASTTLSFDAEFGDYTAMTTVQYNCGCMYGGMATYGGGIQVPVQQPTTADPYHWGTESDTPSGCSGAPYYWNVRDYQVKDQSGSPINRVLGIGETMSSQTANCFNVSISSTGGGNSQPNGTFRDNLYLCDSPVCNSGGSCTFGRDQTFSADFVNLPPIFRQTYTCSSASVAP